MRLLWICAVALCLCLSALVNCSPDLEREKNGGPAPGGHGLSSEEAKKRLKILVTRMDKNKDGFVDKAELSQWVIKSFDMIEKEDADERMLEEDDNKDGKVSWDEHLAEILEEDVKGPLVPDTPDEKKGFDAMLKGLISSVTALFEKHFSQQPSGKHRMVEEDKVLFKAADKDGDGHLNKKEFHHFANPDDFSHMHEILYKQTLERHDDDKDGHISLHEFVDDDAKPGSEDYNEDAKLFKEEYDEDGNGKLSKTEVLDWIVDDDEIAEEEAEHLLENSDSNKDGKLSVQEILDHHEVFVGSEATDFGEHLKNAHKIQDEL